MSGGRDADAAGRTGWARAQLDAARRFCRQVDADWLPGEPYVRRVWSIEGAWQALLAYLARHGAAVTISGSEINVTTDAETMTYRLDPASWTDYLNAVGEPDGDEVVPAAVPLSDGLPLWATDELFEAGAYSSTITLIGGRLAGVDEVDVDVD